MSPILTVEASILTTVQDLGRPGARRFGVPISGAMDAFALEVANRLVGNPPDAAGLELTAGGAAFVLQSSTLLALTGADLGARLDGAALPLWTAVQVRPGSRLTLSGRSGGAGARAYLALAGGIDVPPVLGSRSTCLPGGFGGLQGRPLRAGDQLSCLQPAQDLARYAGRRWPAQARPVYRQLPALRMLPGPHVELFTIDALEQLQQQPLLVSRDSNRMGYRLQGLQLRYARPVSLPSLGVLPGVIQVPPAGDPILLLADCQPTGGYPIIGVVIAPDLPLAAQLLPGDQLRFSLASEEQARAAWAEQQRWRLAGSSEDDDVLFSAWAGMPP